MAKKKSEEAEQPRSPNVEELWQDCPKCGGEFLVRNWSEKGIDYRCSNCKHEEFREWK